MDASAHYNPIVEQVARLRSLLNTLQENHTSLRAQNDRVVKTGISIESVLKPVEDGIRIETERRVAEDAARRTEFGRPGEEGGEKEDLVRAVGGV